METWNGEKERQKERGEEKQTLAIFTCFGDFKIMPICCADNLEMHTAVWFQPRAAFYLASPQEGRDVSSMSTSSHTWSSHKFDACHLEHKYQMLAWFSSQSTLFLTFKILIPLICEEKQN